MDRLILSPDGGARVDRPFGARELPTFGRLKFGPFTARRVVPIHYGIPDFGRTHDPGYALRRDVRTQIFRRMNSLGQMSLSPGGGTWKKPIGLYPPHLATKKLNYSQATPAKGVAGGLVFETQRSTSASTQTPTQQNEYLVGIWVFGGGVAGAGAWQFLYDGVHSTNFPTAGSGMDATGAIGMAGGEFYPLNYGPIGQNIPSAPQTYISSLTAIYFIFSNKPNPLGYSLETFVSVLVTGNESGTSGTSKTYSIPGPLGKPTGILALSDVQAGSLNAIGEATINFPAIGNYGAYFVPAMLARGEVPYYVHPVPDYDVAASFALTHQSRILPGATSMQVLGMLFYRWA